VLAGIVLLSLSFVIINLAKVFVAEHVLVQLKVLLPLKLPYAGTAILSLLLGILLAFLSNLFKKENKAT